MFGWIANKLAGQKVLTKPEQLVPHIIDNFDEAAEDQIAAAEAQVRRAYPRSPEIALLYALRVSKCVPRVTTFRTLASRWRTAYAGPRGAVGLLPGRQSGNYRLAYEFLSSLYLKRFCELAKAIADKAEESAAKRKSAAAKRNVYEAAIRKIRDGGQELDHYGQLNADALLWRQDAKRWTDYLEQRATGMHVETNRSFPVEIPLVATQRLDQRQRQFGHLLKLDHTLNGAILLGLDGHIIEVQARATEVLRRPCPVSQATSITGMATGAVREVLQRTGGAFAKLGIPQSDVAILINLAPADLPKYGTWLDLPLAIIMLQACGYLPDLPEHKEGDFILMGEVGIHSEIRRVPGALSLAYTAKPGQSLIVPTGNEKECVLILAKPGHEGCGVYPVSTLDEVIDFFKGTRKLENALRQRISFEPAVARAVDFGRIRGQPLAREAGVICAAGGHNLLLIGPPGEGKSLLASALPGILPKLRDDEKVELTRIYSACGKLNHDAMAVTRRAMRPVHHTASKAAIIGGGSGVPQPGEITLAHLGILFLDELAEFPRATLEALRQPIEQGWITISRTGATLRFPSQFTLLAAMNPCPCGFFGTGRCTCRDSEVDKYQKRISGPLLDRIDLQVELKPLSTEERFAETEDNVSPRLRQKVEHARQLQTERFAGTDIPFNAAIPGGHVREYCTFSDEGFACYKTCIETNTLSTRSMDRLAKVSRTVADLAAAQTVQPLHVKKAAKYVVGGILRERF